VGISDYQDPTIPKLQFTAADAQAFYNQLVSPEQSGYSPSNVRLLLNEQASRRNIEKAISGWLFQSATADSTAVIFFAGHGGQESDKTGIEKDGIAKYLLPWDADREDLFSSGLSNSRFHELLQTIKSQRLVVFMDACYAAGVTEGSRDIGLVESPYRKLAEGDGRIVIASAQPNQRSWEDQTLGHGIFTYHLLEALGGKADADNDGCASVMDIFRYLQDTVPMTARKVSQSLQVPVLFGDRISHDVMLTVSQKRMLESARLRQEAERLRSQEIKERRRKLYLMHDGGEMPLDAFQEAMELIEKPRGSMAPDELALAGLLDALLDDKVPLSVYLGLPRRKRKPTDVSKPNIPTSDASGSWTASGLRTAPPPVPPEHRRHVIERVPEPVKPAPPPPPPPKVEPPKLEHSFCIYCGSKVIGGNRFCVGCGKPYR
jgi:hypothetical protein